MSFEPKFIGIAEKGRGLVAVFERHAPPGKANLLLLDAKKLEARIASFTSKGWECSQSKEGLAAINAMTRQKT